MADSLTPNFELTLPEVTASEDTWGLKLNDNFVQLDALLRKVFPTGHIAMWSGSRVPEGWALCDGSNGTPDLRGRFIMGAGGGDGVNAIGGENQAELSVSEIPPHTHTGTTDTTGAHTHTGTTSSAGSHTHSGSANSAGSHTHSYRRYASLGSFRGTGWTNTSSRSTSSAGNHSHSLSINSNGSHTHSISTATGGEHSHAASSGSEGGDSAHENRPPYYALAMIMLLPET